MDSPALFRTLAERVARALPPRAAFAAAVALAYAAYIAAYGAINANGMGRPARALYLPGEERLPLVPELALLYAAGFLLPLLVLWKIPTARRFLGAMAAFGITVAVAFSTFLLFPVCLERPAVSENTLRWLRFAYLDGPCNNFPSLHVAIGWLVYFFCRDAVKHRRALLLLITGISLSTVLVKQHYVLDVVAGVLLAAGSWKAAGALLPEDVRASRRRDTL